MVAFWPLVAVIATCGHLLLNVGVKAGKILMHIEADENRVIIAIIFLLMMRPHDEQVLAILQF